MNLDATFTENGSEYGIALEGDVIYVYVDGVQRVGAYVGPLTPPPDPNIIEPDPEPDPAEAAVDDFVSTLFDELAPVQP